VNHSFSVNELDMTPASKSISTTLAHQCRLKTQGLGGVELVVSDDHAGLTAAICEVLPDVAWQRCYVGPVEEPG
jgi:transposase-like protein